MKIKGICAMGLLAVLVVFSGCVPSVPSTTSVRPSFSESVPVSGGSAISPAVESTPTPAGMTTVAELKAGLDAALATGEATFQSDAGQLFATAIMGVPQPEQATAGAVFREALEKHLAGGDNFDETLCTLGNAEYSEAWAPIWVLGFARYGYCGTEWKDAMDGPFVSQWLDHGGTTKEIHDRWPNNKWEPLKIYLPPTVEAAAFPELPEKIPAGGKAVKGDYLLLYRNPDAKTPLSTGFSGVGSSKKKAYSADTLKNIILVDKSWKDITDKKLYKGASKVYQCVMTVYAIDAATGKAYSKKTVKDKAPASWYIGQDTYTSCRAAEAQATKVVKEFIKKV
ncbi:MAG: hypothetical protein LBU38_00310 [Propionibacteriaceae bacterium]|jgi:hypothetical protein|nr:hypothetical protein [Propionibacteriaceae bacterium]